MGAEHREGDVLAGRFRLDRRLGEGGMGVVWAATNTTTRRRVAIKLLKDDRADDPQVRRRFLREGRAASAVQHPNVVEILDVVELDDGTPAMVMELLEGESLGQRLRRERSLELREVASVLLPAVAAIGTAHAHGVVHRDLKPDNIFLARDHEGGVVVKVLDFGIAKMTADGDHAQTDGLTGTGAMLGTPYYMAPEQLFTDETIDYRCDVWALGVILYECLAGARPTQGDNFADIVKVIVTRAIPRLGKVAPDVPAEVSDLVMGMLSFEKEQRPQTLREVSAVLAHYTDVLASSFGEPVLRPVKQSLESSGEVPSGLRRADIDLLVADDPVATSDAAAAPTLDAPPPTAPDTQSRLSLGITLGSAKKATAASGNVSRRARMRWLVLGAVATLAAVGLLGRAAMRQADVSPASAAPPPSAVEAIPAPPSPPPRAEAPAAPPGAAPPATAPPIEQAETAAAPRRPPASRAAPAREPRVQPPAAPAAPSPATPSAPARDPEPRSPGGLVEKPPF